MKTLFSLCLIGLIVVPLLPLASAPGICTELQPRFGRLDDVHFSSQSIQTGDTITITGNITSLVQQDLQGYLSIHSGPSPHGRWTVVSIEPSGKMINITQFSRVPFSMTIKALQPGTYKLSPVLYLPEIGPAFSILNGCNTEPVVTVTGDPMCNHGFVAVSKAEDGSSFCVKHDTVQELIERGWAMNVPEPNPMVGLDNDTGITTLGNHTYYFETPHYNETAYVHPLQISFHDVIFTLFPSGYRGGGLPAWGCGGIYYASDAKFSDGTSELLQIFVGSQDCHLPQPSTYFSTHSNPQAGLTFYDGKMKLLVSTSAANSSGSYLPASFMPCDTPFVQKQSDVSPLFPNDTQITTSYTPVFFMPTNSTGNLCVHYTNGNTPSQSSVRIFEAQNLSKNADDMQVLPQSVAIPTGNTNTTFTIKSGNSGFYGIGFLCGGFPLAVGYDNNSKLIEGDFPWMNQDFNCPAITYSLDFVGTKGIGTYYIPTVTHSKIDYNITGTSVSSVHLTPTIQNITFVINVQTFNDSSNFWFDIKDSNYVKFNGDPKLVEESSDPCTWTFTNDNAVPDESHWYKMTGKVTVIDRPVTFPPHTNGTYSFSILAKDLDTGYYGIDPIFYGRPTDSNVPLENMGGGSVASYYPVVIGLDKYLDPSGVCSR